MRSERSMVFWVIELLYMNCRQETLIQIHWEVDYLKLFHHWNGPFLRGKEKCMCTALLDWGGHQLLQSLTCSGFVGWMWVFHSFVYFHTFFLKRYVHNLYVHSFTCSGKYSTFYIYSSLVLRLSWSLKCYMKLIWIRKYLYWTEYRDVWKVS